MAVRSIKSFDFTCLRTHIHARFIHISADFLANSELNRYEIAYVKGPVCKLYLHY